MSLPYQLYRGPAVIENTVTSPSHGYRFGQPFRDCWPVMPVETLPTVADGHFDLHVVAADHATIAVLTVAGIRYSGTAKRAPGDRHNPQAGVMLAVSRALAAAAAGVREECPLQSYDHTTDDNAKTTEALADIARSLLRRAYERTEYETDEPAGMLDEPVRSLYRPGSSAQPADDEKREASGWDEAERAGRCPICAVGMTHTGSACPDMRAQRRLVDELVDPLLSGSSGRLPAQGRACHPHLPADHECLNSEPVGFLTCPPARRTLVRRLLGG